MRPLSIWTREQEQAVIALRDKGLRPQAIAIELGLPHKRVVNKIQQLRIRDGGKAPVTKTPQHDADPRKRPARRKCLGCGRAFPSSHAGNRMCRSCGGNVAHGGFAGEYRTLSGRGWR